MKFRKKPVVIEAVRWSGQNFGEISAFAGTGLLNNGGFISIQTLEGTMRASPGDWIIKGVKGEFYPCRA